MRNSNSSSEEGGDEHKKKKVQRKAYNKKVGKKPRTKKKPTYTGRKVVEKASQNLRVSIMLLEMAEVQGDGLLADVVRKALVEVKLAQELLNGESK